MSGLVERVARAICYAFYAPTGDITNPERHADLLWRGFEDQARAAIAAMREPTEAMFMAGSNAEPYDRDGVRRRRGRRIGDLPARDCWRLMIDAALKDD